MTTNTKLIDTTREIKENLNYLRSLAIKSEKFSNKIKEYQLYRWRIEINNTKYYILKSKYNIYLHKNKSKKQNMSKMHVCLALLRL